MISPLSPEPELLSRDIAVMAALTLLLFAMCWGFRTPGRIDRARGLVLLACYIGYTVYLATTVVSGAA